MAASGEEVLARTRNIFARVNASDCKAQVARCGGKINVDREYVMASAHVHTSAE